MPFFKNPIPVKPKTLGIPYKGSKSLIAERLMLLLPSANYFVDLFAGGCAMTHAAVLSNKYRHIIANDITDVPSLFVDAARGKYSQETRWISKEDFMQLKDTEPYIRTCWSFGNNNRTYIYSKAIEPYKKRVTTLSCSTIGPCLNRCAPKSYRLPKSPLTEYPT